jgi:hypothetical protein
MNPADEYEKYEQACEQIKRENRGLLSEFAAWMSQQGISEKTAGMHVANAAFYIQEYLLYEQPLRASEGATGLGMYLGYWFIRKAAWPSPQNLKSNATSLLKFYSFMLAKGLVTAEQLAEMRASVRAQMPHWQERARRHSDPAIDDPEKIWI